MVKTLILCATFAKSNARSSESITEVQILMEKFDLEHKFKVRAAALYSRSFRKTLRKDKKLNDILKREFMEDPTTLQDWINQGSAVSEHDTEDKLQTIKQPTLILVGDDDHIMPTLKFSQILHDKIPNSQLEIIKDTGHRFNYEKPELINNIIWNFIEQYIG